MHFSPLLAFSSLSLLASNVGAQITLGQDFQASSTLLLTSIASPSLLDNGTIAGAAPSTPPAPSPFVKKVYGSMAALDSPESYRLTVHQWEWGSYGVPDIDEPLDVFTVPDIDLDIWFTISYVSPCIAHYTCNGTTFHYTYTYTGLICGPPLSSSAAASPTSLIPVPISSSVSYPPA
ncbi:hypothetical protein ONZ45_g8177 [Pleurotus djamor]|nr:hypothetical protein ONZ45_g8177 [Pleurotus djamor]